MPLPADRKYRYLTDAQADYITNLVEARFSPDDPGRALLRNQFSAIRTHADVTEMIEMLKKLPTLAQQERDRAADEVPDAEGFYRNPETGELWRLRTKKWDLAVSKYSETGGPRRLVADDSKIVKGKWRNYSGFASRMMLNRGEVKKSWKIDEATLATEYAYGFCPLHGGPLTDAVSVILGYGPDCAKKYGKPWGEEYAQQVLAARQEVSS